VKSLRILPEVAEEVAEAAGWYDEEGYLGLGDRFIETFYSAGWDTIMQPRKCARNAKEIDFMRLFAARLFPHCVVYAAAFSVGLVLDSFACQAGPGDRKSMRL